MRHSVNEIRTNKQVTLVRTYTNLPDLSAVAVTSKSEVKPVLTYPMQIIEPVVTSYPSVRTNISTGTVNSTLSDNIRGKFKSPIANRPTDT